MLLFANERLSRLPSCLHRPFCLLQLRLAEEILYEFGVEPTDVVLRNIMDSAAVGRPTPACAQSSLGLFHVADLSTRVDLGGEADGFALDPGAVHPR